MFKVFWRRQHGLSVDDCWCYIISALILLFAIAVDKSDVASLRVALAAGRVLAGMTRVVGWDCFFGG